MKSKPYYPIFFNICGLRCLVVGGGPIAERKVESLLAAGAKVKVVCPAITAKLHKLYGKGKFQWLKTKYKENHLKGVRLVIGATEDRNTNEKIFRDAEHHKIPVNIVDDQNHCRFIVPATFRRKDIQIAVTTGGAAPGLSRKIREELEKVIGKEYGVLASELKKERTRIKALSMIEKEKFWKKIASLHMNRYRCRENELRNKVDKWLLQAEKGDNRKTVKVRKRKKYCNYSAYPVQPSMLRLCSLHGGQAAQVQNFARPE